MRSWFARWRLSVQVACGVVLVLVPTAYTVWPDDAPQSGTNRAWISVVWVAAALILTILAALRDGRIEDVAGSHEARVRQLRVLAFDRCVESLCRSPQGIPTGFSVTVYLPAKKRLVPIYPLHTAPGEDLRIFESGRGATGTAWARKRLVVVKGSAVSDGDYALTPEQQDYFRPYQTAVSYPILDPTQELTGVVTLLSEALDDSFDEGGSSQPAIRELADVLGVVLTNVYPEDT